MIVRHGYKTYEEAEREVMELVWKDKYNKRDELHFQVYSRSDENGKRLPISYIKCKETGGMASIYSFDEAEGYAITLLTGEEASEENRTYPYRGISETAFPFLLALHTPIFKPVREIRPEDVLTRNGLKEVYSFFGVEEEELTLYGGFLTDEETKSKGYTIETAFDENGTLICLPFPQVLTLLTGVKVETSSDYANGISFLLKDDLSEKQEKDAKDTFTFYASDAFLRYAIYEFFRTENYSHLKEVLASCKAFYLPDGWEADFPPYYSYANIVRGEHFSTEVYVLGKYLSKWNASIVGKQARLRDVAEYTGTPFALMNRAYRISHICDL